jgi:hypothetical protein
VSYAIGGTIAPPNSVAEYLHWPGSPFVVHGMTGAWQHDGVIDAAVYALALLIGRRGFFEHNLPVVLAVAGAVALARRRPAETPEIACGAAWCAATWLGCALASHNYSGECASVRWFVPFLAPAYLALAVTVRDDRRMLSYLMILSAWGALLGARMWWSGPWTRQTGVLFWLLQAGALASCLVWYGRQRSRRTAAPRRHAAPERGGPSCIATHG